MPTPVRSIACLLVAASVASAHTNSPPAAAPPSPKVARATDLSILCAGFPGGEREKNFVEFLASRFPKVATIDLQSLDSNTAVAFDVVVADWKSRCQDGRPIAGSDPQVRRDPAYSKPTITIGAVGFLVCGGKLDWL